MPGCQVVCVLRTGQDTNPTRQLVRESARVMFTTLSQTDCEFPQRLSPTHRPPGLVADDRTGALARKSGPRRPQHEAARRPHETLTPDATAFALRRFGLPTAQLQPLWQRRAARAFGQLALVSFSICDITLGGPFGRAIGLPLPFPVRSRSSSGRLAPVHL